MTRRGPRLWARFMPRRRIVTRVVSAVTAAMSVLLLLAGAFVFWRVQYALDRQLNQDLAAYSQVGSNAVLTGQPLPSGTPGEATQLYSPQGELIESSDPRLPRLAPRTLIRRAALVPVLDVNTSHLLLPAPHAYRVRIFEDTTPSGTTVVVAAAISRQKHDEALRELLLQLAVTDLLVIVASGFVGYGAARAALGPVEAYRVAASAAVDAETQRLPVATDREDELTRLGTTFNAMLDAIAEGHARERQFLADASHELRSPLTLLAAEIEWARHRPRNPEEIGRVLGSVGKSVDRLVELSNDLLDLEELHDGSTPERNLTRLDDVVAGAVEPHRDALTQAGRALDVTAEPAQVWVDRHWVGLALGNLVGNAVKHGVGTVRVEAAVAAGRVRIEVQDEGPGIPEDFAARAFDRFTRAEASRTTAGNGLGLALVRAVARQHDGRVGLLRGGVWLELAGVERLGGVGGVSDPQPGTPGSRA